MSKKHLLLVEDSPADVDLVEEVLTEFENNIELHPVTNGLEALDFLHEREDFADTPVPDLILLDLDLPKMDGFEFLEELRSTDQLKHLPVVVLTMSNAKEDIMRVYRSQACCCLTKPLGFEDFRKIMEGVNNFWFELVQLPPELSEVK